MFKTNGIYAALLAKLTAGKPDQLAELEILLSSLPESIRRETYQEILSYGLDTDLNTLSSPVRDMEDPWKIYTLRDAYQPREPIKYVVNGLLALPSLNIVYGAPGDLKSMLLADLITSVAAGTPWLSPRSDALKATTFQTVQAPVLWLDFDNGKYRTEERFEAMGRARNLPENTPLHYATMPSPWLSASNKDDINILAKRILKLQVKLCVIDNLGVTAGVRDENSSEMSIAMANLRWLAESTGTALVAIHHQRKSNGQGGRRGDSLRGHSSIEASLDLALQIDRPEGSSQIIVRATKVRGAEVMPFGALFTYDHRPGTSDLYEARFFGVSSEDIMMDKAAKKNAGKVLDDEIKDAILELVEKDPAINQTHLIQQVKTKFKNSGQQTIQGLVDGLVEEERLNVERGKRNAKLYTVKE